MVRNFYRGNPVIRSQSLIHAKAVQMEAMVSATPTAINQIPLNITIILKKMVVNIMHHRAAIIHICHFISVCMNMSGWYSSGL